MNRSIRHQDANGDAGAPLGAFLSEARIGLARPGEDPAAFRARVGADYPGEYFEVLTVCLEHPDTPAVDCTICAPEE
jgi:hypothetical protein